jgi:hypothetical protein
MIVTVKSLKVKGEIPYAKDDRSDHVHQKKRSVKRKLRPFIEKLSYVVYPITGVSG